MLDLDYCGDCTCVFVTSGLGMDAVTRLLSSSCRRARCCGDCRARRGSRAGVLPRRAQPVV